MEFRSTFGHKHNVNWTRKSTQLFTWHVSMAKFFICTFAQPALQGPTWLVRPFLVFTFICQDNATKIWRKLFGLRDSSLQRVKSVTGPAQCKSGLMAVYCMQVLYFSVLCTKQFSVFYQSHLYGTKNVPHNAIWLDSILSTGWGCLQHITSSNQ